MVTFFEDKNPVTTAILVVIALGAIFALVEGNVTGAATRSGVEPMPFPVYIEKFIHPGWGSCDAGGISLVAVDRYCKSLGKSYTGVAPDRWKPCAHEWKPTRYFWDGTITADGKLKQGTWFTAGYALTQVRCAY